MSDNVLVDLPTFEALATSLSELSVAQNRLTGLPGGPTDERIAYYATLRVL